MINNPPEALEWLFHRLDRFSLPNIGSFVRQTGGSKMEASRKVVLPPVEYFVFIPNSQEYQSDISEYLQEHYDLEEPAVLEMQYRMAIQLHEYLRMNGELSIPEIGTFSLNRSTCELVFAAEKIAIHTPIQLDEQPLLTQQAINPALSETESDEDLAAVFAERAAIAQQKPSTPLWHNLLIWFSLLVFVATSIFYLNGKRATLASALGLTERIQSKTITTISKQEDIFAALEADTSSLYIVEFNHGPTHKDSSSASTDSVDIPIWTNEPASIDLMPGGHLPTKLLKTPQDVHFPAPLPMAWPTASPDSAGYHLITQLAYDSTLALAAYAYWKQKGFKPQLLPGPFTASFRVSILQSTDKAHCLEKLKVLRHKGIIPVGSWVLTVLPAEK
jgi:hypothetical protein